MNSEISFLKENILKEEKLAKELLLFSNLYKSASKQERGFLEKSCSGVINQIEIIHNSTESFINNLASGQVNIKEAPKFSKPKETKNYVRVSTTSGDVFIKKEDKKKYLEELKIRRFKAKEIVEEKQEIQKPSQFIMFSSKLFKGLSKSLANNFNFLDKDLKQADMPYIPVSYLSMCLLLFFISLFLFLAVFIALSLGKSPLVLVGNMAIALIIPIGFFIFLVYYPKIQVGSNSKKIENEMPFALAHMSAVASSKIAPQKIFSIMADSKEYPFFSRQMKKVSNQINIYGYDLTTALKNVAQQSSNKKFAEFLNGFTSIVSSGGDILLYIKEKSKDALMDYKLSRERYSSTIGLYSDIYTALLIAAPLILMLVLSFMSSLGASLGNFSLSFLANVGVIAIVILNILFIIFLNLTQPET